MKITIGIVGALGLFLILCGRITSRSKNPDEASSATVPYVMGGALLAGDVVLTVGWGLYRLFTS